MVGLGAAALAAAGFVWFVIPPTAETGPAQTDAIVVLTGGSLRLRSGIDLMREAKGRTLFVTGVDRGVGLDELVHSVGERTPRWLACCVVLGHEAENTVGNAIETAQWMQQEGYHSLRLVTSWYHMPRSLLEFKRAMPDLEIIPYPVFSGQAKPQRWWTSRGTATVLMAEYSKYLAALFVPFVDRPGLRGSHEIGAEARR
jgi:uncharacterized SAM-binding protein YcdF (DUF218 family)